jgi:hypothetical protein
MMTDADAEEYLPKEGDGDEKSALLAEGGENLNNSNRTNLHKLEESVIHQTQKIKEGAQHGAENLVDGMKQDWGHVKAGAALIYDKFLGDHDNTVDEEDAASTTIITDDINNDDINNAKVAYPVSEKVGSDGGKVKHVRKIENVAKEANKRMKSLRAYLDDLK